MLKNGWVIRTASKSFAVYAATITEKQEWMAHIQRCVSELLKKSGKKAVEQHAALWVPDAEATTCKGCQSAFTFVNRRHHCRNDGEFTAEVRHFNYFVSNMGSCCFLLLFMRFLSGHRLLQ